MRLPFALLIAASIAAACSSGGSSSNTPAGSLDCAWFAGDNCWKSTLAQATSCLPPKGETGTLSADMKSCTYGSGTVVTFDSPLVLPVPDDPMWAFTVSTAGQQCLRLQDTSDSSFTLTVNGQTFSEAAAGIGLQVTCPDKTSFAASNAFDLFDCSDGGLFDMGIPGKAWSNSPTSVSLQLIGGANGSMSVFSCRKP